MLAVSPQADDILRAKSDRLRSGFVLQDHSSKFSTLTFISYTNDTGSLNWYGLSSVLLMTYKLPLL